MNPYDPTREVELAVIKAQRAREKALEEAKEKVIKNFIIDINNRLHSLCGVMNFDIKEIQQIAKTPIIKDKYGFPERDTDEYKKAIIDAVLADEENIDNVTLDTSPLDIKMSETDSRDVFRGDEPDHRFQFIKKLRPRKIATQPIAVNTGQPPPKTDWKNINVGRHEQYKILRSLKENPESKSFSKEFKYETKDFISAFKYLESTKKYNGPFIVSIIDEEKELDKYLKVKSLNAGVKNIQYGKYLLLSLYDITSVSNDSKYIYLGLIYNKKEGRLFLDTAGSLNGNIKTTQKLLVREFLDCMEISYNDNHGNLEI